MTSGGSSNVRSNEFRDFLAAADAGGSQFDGVTMTRKVLKEVVILSQISDLDSPSATDHSIANSVLVSLSALRNANKNGTKDMKAAGLSARIAEMVSNYRTVKIDLAALNGVCQTYGIWPLKWRHKHRLLNQRK